MHAGRPKRIQVQDKEIYGNKELVAKYYRPETTFQEKMDILDNLGLHKLRTPLKSENKALFLNTKKHKRLRKPAVSGG